jgi:diguanylate cyclase (GGDEF)-like protein/PAS domain S-box-containing protein
MQSFAEKPVRLLVSNLIFAVCYAGLGFAGLLLPYLESSVSMIWPPAGFALALLWRLGFLYTPAVFIGAFSLAYFHQAPFSSALGGAIGNVAGPMLAVWLLRRKQIRFQLDSTRDFLWFLLFTLGPGAGLTAINGCLQLWSYAAVSSAQLPVTIVAWWLGDAFGVLIFGVPLLCFTYKMWQSIGKFEFVLLQVLTALICMLLFLHPVGRDLPETLLFMPLFVMIWLVLRQGLWSAAVCILQISIFSVLGTSAGRGSFSGEDPLQAVFAVWSYAFFLCVICFVVLQLQAKAVHARGHINSALEGSALGIWDFDLRRRIVHFYGEARGMLGYLEDDIGNDVQSWANLLHPQDAQNTRDALLQHVKGLSDIYQVEFRLKHRDGSWTWIFSQGRVVERDDSGRATRMVGSNADISKLKQADLAVEQLKDFYATVLNKVVTGVWVCNDQHQIIFANDGLAHMVGMSVVELQHKQVLTDFAEETLRHFRPHYYRAQHALTPVRFEAMPMTTPGGRDVFLNGWLVPLVKSGQFDGMICTVDDITQQRQYEQQMLQLAYIDQLTQLPNRASLAEKAREFFAKAMQQQQQLAVFYLDLDHFQHINDTMGHQTGDDLLQQVAIRLQMLVIAEDILGRLGGDEFLLIKHCQNDGDVLKTASQLQQLMAEPFVVGERILHVSPSIGIALFPQHGLSFAELLRVADVALYEAKQAGRRSYSLYSHQMTERLQERLQLEHGMRSGIYTGQFSLHYQPIMRVQTQQVEGVEALLRWQHPQLGAISPVKFIPLAEQSGFIVELGYWVLQQAIAQAARWQQAGPRLRVAVNISTVQLMHGDFFAKLNHLLKVHALDPTLLELELTESVLAQQVEMSRKLLTKIQQLGVRLSLDDFGTGYSSLAYLKSFPIHKLKIDRSFIQDLLSDPDDRAIVHSVVVLGHSLGMSIVAEGVEVADQFRQLEQMEVDEIQGYFLSKALPAAELELWLAKQHSLGLF